MSKEQEVEKLYREALKKADDLQENLRKAINGVALPAEEIIVALLEFCSFLLVERVFQRDRKEFERQCLDCFKEMNRERMARQEAEGRSPHP